jgi:hypothetical protein
VSLLVFLLSGLLLALLALPALAHTTPPDPLWIPGIYDEADGDDVMRLLVDDGLAVRSASRANLESLPPNSRSRDPFRVTLVTAAAFGALRVRSPPIADQHA